MTSSRTRQNARRRHFAIDGAIDPWQAPPSCCPSRDAVPRGRGWDGTRWTWIDGTLRILRALDPQGNSMSLRETSAALSDAKTPGSIRFTRLDPSTGAWSTRTYGQQDEAFRVALATDITPDKTIDVRTEAVDSREALAGAREVPWGRHRGALGES